MRCALSFGVYSKSKVNLLTRYVISSNTSPVSASANSTQKSSDSVKVRIVGFNISVTFNHFTTDMSFQSINCIGSYKNKNNIHVSYVTRPYTIPSRKPPW